MTLADLPRTGEIAERDFVLRFFPVFDFLRHHVAALFCTPMYDGGCAEAIYGHGAFRFSAAEWAEIDCAILEHTLGFATELLRHGIVAAVGASVSFATLCDPRGRMAYREALRATQVLALPNLVIKIENIPATAGGRRVGEMVQSLKPLARRAGRAWPGDGRRGWRGLIPGSVRDN